ncbi:MAG: 6-phosphofructokinase [Clostridiales bacterium]|nr:6-phosphofructokinase [Clostridiales bacterium]
MQRIGILTSGGDAPGMNAAVRAAVRSAIYYDMEVYGIERGYEGLLDGDIKEMKVSSVSDILQRGGTVLRTARSDRFMTQEGQKRAADMLENFEIDSLVVVGGDGSFRGALELSKHGVCVMGVPGTIDNDLGYTDYTIGFDTAVNTVLGAISNIRDTSSSHDRTTIIEVMGRHCGDIAIHAGLTGGAEYVLVPEEDNNINALCRKVIEGRKRGKLHSVIIKAEGVEMPSQELADIIKERTGLETKIVILGYIQRGGSPSARDRMLASRMAYKAVELIREGSVNKAIGVIGDEIVHFDIAEALEMKRPFDDGIVKMANILSI